jgi:hypothetical protein
LCIFSDPIHKRSEPTIKGCVPGRLESLQKLGKKILSETAKKLSQTPKPEGRQEPSEKNQVIHGKRSKVYPLDELKKMRIE